MKLISKLLSFYNKKKELDPLEYFSKIKSKIHSEDAESINKLIKLVEDLKEKADKLDQNYLKEKADFYLNSLRRELVIKDLGVTKYILKDDILEFIDKVDKQVIKICELSKFPRVIPDEVSDKIQAFKKNKIFDEYFIVFTDYTGKVEKEIKAEDRRHDPVVFGVFIRDGRSYSSLDDLFDRFYFLADWEDDYCDLTFNRMISKMNKKAGVIRIPLTKKKLESEVNSKEFNEEVKSEGE